MQKLLIWLTQLETTGLTDLTCAYPVSPPTHRYLGMTFLFIEAFKIDFDRE